MGSILRRESPAPPQRDYLHLDRRPQAPIELPHHQPIRVAVTSDLHLERLTPQEMAAFIDEVWATEADVFILAGDTANGASTLLAETFHRLSGCAPVCLTVPGNHDMWGDLTERPRPGTTDRWYRHYMETARSHGFVPLDADGPIRVNHLGIAGTMGWYDYSMRDERIQVPMSVYREKWSDHFRTGWNDGAYVGWSVSDEKVTNDQLARLARQLDQLEADSAVASVVAITHHLPYQELVRRKPGTSHYEQEWNLANAWMGSVRFGELYRNYPKIRTAFCGHSHHHQTIQVGQIEAIMNGRPGRPAISIRHYSVS